MENGQLIQEGPLAHRISYIMHIFTTPPTPSKAMSECEYVTDSGTKEKKRKGKDKAKKSLQHKEEK